MEAIADLVQREGWWVRADRAEYDLVAVREVYQGDCYRMDLYDIVGDPPIVIDIGAHIGSWARLVHEKNPRARIICVEACPENMPALRANVGDFAQVVHAACTYEEGELGLLNCVSPGGQGTGGSMVGPRAVLEKRASWQPAYKYQRDLRPLAQVTLEQLMQMAGADHIDYLKLDCEFSEYSILGQTPSLHKIRFIFGEAHDRGRWEAFRRGRFRAWNYGVMSACGDFGVIFHLANPVWPPQGKILRLATLGGIGDSLWVLTKVPALLEREGCDKAFVTLCGPPPYRAADFVAAFDFVAGADYSDLGVTEGGPDADGKPRYAASQPGWHDRFDWFLEANSTLERGRRLEGWLPELATDWNIGRHFRFKKEDQEFTERLAGELGPFCVFYFGPEAGNTTYGHNRGPLWRPEDWVKLERGVRGLGLEVVGVGAPYDLSYFENHLAPAGLKCHNAIGQWPIGRTFAVIKQARFVIAYQSGVGIFCPYMGVRAGCFWRPKGNSIAPDVYLSFEEDMAHCWVPPGVMERGDYLPLIYGRVTPESLLGEIGGRGWHHGSVG
jgi:FkbM family methyltransferase